MFCVKHWVKSTIDT